MSYTPKSTCKAIREAFTEYSRGLGVVGKIKTWRNGQWAVAKIGKDESSFEYRAFLRIGSAWHMWHQDGASASGYCPGDDMCLGDVIETDRMLATYEAKVNDCPSAICNYVNVR